jgi:hypothetical protein
MVKRSNAISQRGPSGASDRPGRKHTPKMMKGLKGDLKGTQSWHRTHVRLVLKLGYPDDGLPCTYLTGDIICCFAAA